jgi:hypothetical protein
VASNLEDEVIAPLRSFAQNRIGIPTALMSFATPLGWANARLADDLNRLLFKSTRLADLPAAPHILLNAVELTTADAVRFTSYGGLHTRLGDFHDNDIPLATAVAAACPASCPHPSGRSGTASCCIPSACSSCMRG